MNAATKPRSQKMAEISAKIRAKDLDADKMNLHTSLERIECAAKCGESSIDLALLPSTLTHLELDGFRCYYRHGNVYRIEF